MDGLKMICEELDRCTEHGKCNDYNEIVCAKSVLRRYIGNDRNRLLKIKAELREKKELDEELWKELPLGLSTIALFLTAASYVLDRNLMMVYVMTALAIITFLTFIWNVYANKISKRKKWNRYIQFALEDLEKEMK